MKLLVIAAFTTALLFLFFPSNTQAAPPAQTPVLTQTIYLPLISNEEPPPPPCDGQSAALSLNSFDFPPAIGWQTIEDTKGLESRAPGWQEECVRFFGNTFFLLFGGTAAIGQDLIIFDTPANAKQAYDNLWQNLEATQDPAHLPSPNLGNESRSYDVTDDELEGHIIYFRRNHIVGSVATAAMRGAEYRDALYFAEILDKRVKEESRQSVKKPLTSNGQMLPSDVVKWVKLALGY